MLHAAFALGVAPVPGYGRRARSRATALKVRGSSITRGPPRVSSPTALPADRVYVSVPGLPHPVRAASRDFHPPDGLLRDLPCGLVSSRSRSWGSTLQSLSSRGAVAPSDARCPPDVRAIDPPTARTRRRGVNGPRARITLVRHRKRWRPVPLAFRAFSSPRGLGPVAQRFRPRGGRSSLGLPPLQGPDPPAARDV